MLEELTSIRSFLALVFALGASSKGAWFLFSKAEIVVTSQKRCQVSWWLRQLDPANAMERWPKTFAAIFDSVFGERHLSWQCIWRSCVASLIGVGILTLIWASIYPDQEIWLTVVLGAVLFNLVPDYLSLLETRYVLRWMGTKPSTGRICALLAFDIVVTGVIFFFMAVLIFVLANILITSWNIPSDPILETISYTVALAWELLVPGFRLSSPDFLDGPSFGIFFYSTYFTSLWVWLYPLSGIVLRLLYPVVILMQRHLDIDNKPIRSLGFVASVITPLIFLVAWVALQWSSSET